MTTTPNPDAAPEAVVPLATIHCTNIAARRAAPGIAELTLRNAAFTASIPLTAEVLATVAETLAKIAEELKADGAPAGLVTPPAGLIVPGQ